MQHTHITQWLLIAVIHSPVFFASHILFPPWKHISPGKQNCHRCTKKVSDVESGWPRPTPGRSIRPRHSAGLICWGWSTFTGVDLWWSHTAWVITMLQQKNTTTNSINRLKCYYSFTQWSLINCVCVSERQIELDLYSDHLPEHQDIIPLFSHLSDLIILANRTVFCSPMHKHIFCPESWFKPAWQNP